MSSIIRNEKYGFMHHRGRVETHELFLTLYAEYADDLLAFGTALGFGREDIQDTLQDVFFNLYQRDPKLQQVRNVKVYLFTALKNRLLNTTRRQRMDSLDAHPSEGRFDVSVSASDLIEDQEERHRLKRQVEEAMASLTPRQREAIYLRYIQEMDYDDIARLLDMTKPSVRNLVSKGLMVLRENVIMLFFICFFDNKITFCVS